MLVQIGDKQHTLPDFPTVGRVNPENFTLCDCPQSKAIQKGCDLGNCNNLSNFDAYQSFKKVVRPRLASILSDIQTEVNANRFIGLQGQAVVVATYLDTLYNDLKKHENWLKSMQGKNRRKQCCASEGDLSQYLTHDKNFIAEVIAVRDVWRRQPALIANLEATYSADVTTTAQAGQQMVALNTQVAAYNVQAAEAAVVIAESEVKVSDLNLSDTKKRLMIAGAVIFGAVVLYFVFKKK